MRHTRMRLLDSSFFKKDFFQSERTHFFFWNFPRGPNTNYQGEKTALARKMIFFSQNYVFLKSRSRHCSSHPKIYACKNMWKNLLKNKNQMLNKMQMYM